MPIDGEMVERFNGALDELGQHISALPMPLEQVPGSGEWGGPSMRPSAEGREKRDALVRTFQLVDCVSAALLEGIEELEVKAITYDQMHEDAKELGYPSILEALEDLGRMRGRVEELERENGWQPIETAPKDREIMLLTERGSVFAPCVFQKAGVISENDFWLVWRATDFDEVPNPTHWMPLPAPPSLSPKEQSSDG